MSAPEPRPFMVSGVNGPQYCELWPAGRVTMRAHGEALVNALSFEDMQGMGWTDDVIEWDVEAPAGDDPNPEPLVQDDLFALAPAATEPETGDAA